MTTNVETGWIYPKYNADPLAAEWVAFLMENSEFGPDEATGGAVWHDPIPNRCDWERDIQSHNKSYRQGQMWEADSWAEQCEQSGPKCY